MPVTLVLLLIIVGLVIALVAVIQCQFLVDRGGVIFPTRGLKAHRAVIRIVQQIEGKPLFTIDDTWVYRTMFRSGKIINCPNGEPDSRLDNVGGVLPLVVKYPLLEAEYAQKLLEGEGFSGVEWWRDVGTMEGGEVSMVFLKCPDAFHGVIIFRVHFSKMGGPKPSLYRD